MPQDKSNNIVESNHEKLEVLIVTKMPDNWKALVEGYMTDSEIDYNVDATNDMEIAKDKCVKGDYDVALIGSELGSADYDSESFYMMAEDHGVDSAIFSVKKFSDQGLEYVSKSDLDNLEENLWNDVVETEL